MSCSNNNDCKKGLKCTNGTCCKGWVLSSRRSCSVCQTTGRYAGNCGCDPSDRSADGFCKKEKEPCSSDIIPWEV